MKSLAKRMVQLSAGALALLATGALAQGGRTVTMYAGPYAPTTTAGASGETYTALATLAQRFEQQTGVKVNFVYPAVTGTDNGIDRAKWQAYLQASIGAGNAPDIVYVPQGPNQSGTGWFLAINDLLDRPNAFVRDNRRWRDLFYPKAVEFVRGEGGRDYFIPYASNYPYIIIGTFYNKELMARAGITALPKDWEEWMQQLARMKAAGIAPMAPFPSESKSGSVWPMWSTLIPPFTAHLVARVDADRSGGISQEEIARAIKSGVISMNDQHFRAAFLQYKRQLSFYLPGWNAADVNAVWNQGRLAQKYGGFWEIYAERSNTQRKFEWGFFPTLPVTRATSPLVTWTPKLAPTGRARLDGINGAAHMYGVIDSSVKRNNNLEAVTQWLQFITTPEANEFVVNENPNVIPGVRGASPDPLWNQLADLPVPDFGPSIYPFGLDQEQQTNLQREVVRWALGQQNDAAFFAAVQRDMVRAADKFLAGK